MDEQTCKLSLVSEKVFYFNLFSTISLQFFFSTYCYLYFLYINLTLHIYIENEAAIVQFIFFTSFYFPE